MNNYLPTIPYISPLISNIIFLFTEAKKAALSLKSGLAQLPSLVWKYRWYAIATTLILAGLLVLSMCWYTGFRYFALQPPEALNQNADVHFIFPQDRKSEPVATIPVKSKWFHEGEITDWELTMVLPESPPNMEVGMFMVNASIGTRTGKVIARAIKPALMRYKSPFARYAYEAFYVIPLVLGWESFDEQQTLTIPLFKDMSYSRNTTYAKITLSSAHLQVYEARLNVNAKPKGVRNAMYHHPYLFFMIGTSVSFVVQLVFTAIGTLCIYFIYDACKKAKYD